MGLSTTGGFELYVQDRTGGGVESLTRATKLITDAAAKRPELQGVRTTFDPNVPQYDIQLDREKAKAMGVPINSVFTAMQATFGSLYVNDFTLFGRNYQVNLQSEAEFRRDPSDLKHVFVRANSGSMIPLDALVTVKRIVGPDRWNASMLSMQRRLPVIRHRVSLLVMRSRQCRKWRRKFFRKAIRLHGPAQPIRK